jgi:hypothetical protein
MSADPDTEDGSSAAAGVAAGNDASNPTPSATLTIDTNQLHRLRVARKLAASVPITSSPRVR